MELEEKIYKGARHNSPFSMAIDVTSRCNFRCMHCFNESGMGNETELSDADFLNVIEQIKEMAPISVCLCGGEPLLRFDLVIKTLSILKDSVGMVNMVSNGWYATRDKLKVLKDAGIHSYQVSLDGVNALQHDNFRGVSGAFDHAINAIKTAVDLGIQTTVAVTPNKLNYKSIDKIIELCYGLGVRFFRSMPLIPMGRGYKNQNVILSSDEYIEYQINLKKARNKYQNLMTVEWGDPLDHLIRMPVNAKAELYTYHIDIKSNGDVVPSTYLPIVFGNVKTEGLKELWESGYNKIWSNPKLLALIKDISETTDVGLFYTKLGKAEKIYLER